MTKAARLMLICVDCMQIIEPTEAPSIIAYFDGRLRSWVCPDCMQERRRLEAIRVEGKKECCT